MELYGIKVLKMELVYEDSVQAGRSKVGVISDGFIFIIKKINEYK
ncbi:hypothetical protein [Mediterraneibacter gnavus]|jgi:hypothetical protein